MFLYLNITGILRGNLSTILPEEVFDDLRRLHTLYVGNVHVLPGVDVSPNVLRTTLVAMYMFYLG